MTATTLSNRTIENLGRQTYYQAMKQLRRLLTAESFDPDVMCAFADVANSASYGFDKESAGDEDDLIEMQLRSEYNDARLDEAARAVFSLAISSALAYCTGEKTVNPERMHALAQAADAAASVFGQEEPEE